MQKIISLAGQNKKISILYLCAVLLSLHYAFVIYTNSSFLSEHISEKAVSFLYMAGALANIAILFRIPHYLKKHGVYRTILSCILLEMTALYGLAFVSNIALVIIFFIIHQSVVSIAIICLDELLEKYSSENKNIGGIRGFYLTSVNIAYVVSPIIAGQFAATKEFWKIYAVAFAFLVPLYLILRHSFKNFRDSGYREMNPVKTAELLEKKTDIFSIYAAGFLLQFFYAWMVIYMPLYLSQTIGLGWDKIGIIFSIMLLPFVIFEFPVGRIEDKRLDEKEMLFAGFVIAGIATIFTSLGNSSMGILFWAISLFITRIGASFIEVTTERYFFRHIKSADSNLISLFRMNVPLSYIIAPAVASLSIYFLGIGKSFAVLGAIMLLGSLSVLFLKRDKKAA